MNSLIFKMARTKQIAHKSIGGKAPRKALATKASQISNTTVYLET